MAVMKSRVRKAAAAAMVALSLASMSHADDSWSRDEAESLLKTWCDALVKYQVDGTGDPCVDGGLICPACTFQHGRAADSVYALVYEWKRTGDGKYLAAAEKVLDWTDRNFISCDGANYNDTKTYWRGITVFAQISLGKTLLEFGKVLPGPLADKMKRDFSRQTGYLLEFFSDGIGGANINYPVAFCEAMAIASRVLDDGSYLERGRRMRALLEPFFTEEGLLQGEGLPQDRVTRRGCKAVDIGYNLEESIPSLWHYAEMAGDAALEETLMKITAAHLEFMLPDGGIDNSMGSRSCKWTYWGSRTSDGVLPALARYARHGGKGGVRAIDRHLRLLAGCTSDTGLLYGGIFYRDAGEPPCIHHTFAHVKSLVDLLLANPPASVPSEPMPREIEYGRRRFSDIDTELVSVGPWRATFSANDHCSVRWGINVGGASPTLLWHRDIGLVAAATMFRYCYVEPTNFQDQRRYIGVSTMTPRIESGKFSNVMDEDVKTSADFSGGVFTYSGKGVMTTGDRVVGAPFELHYRMDADGLCVKARAEGRFDYVFPVVATGEDEVVVDGRTAEVKRRGGTIRIQSNRPVALVETQRGKRAFNPVAGIMAAIFSVGSDGEEVVFSITIRKEGMHMGNGTTASESRAGKAAR